MRLLDRLDLAFEISKAGRPIEYLSKLDEKGNVIGEINMLELNNVHGFPSVSIAEKTLHEVWPFPLEFFVETHAIKLLVAHLGDALPDCQSPLPVEILENRSLIAADHELNDGNLEACCFFLKTTYELLPHHQVEAEILNRKNQKSTKETFDFVIGADGDHSEVHLYLPLHLSYLRILASLSVLGQYRSRAAKPRVSL